MTQQPHGEKYLSNDLARPFLDANYRTFGLQNLSNSTVVLFKCLSQKLPPRKKATYKHITQQKYLHLTALMLLNPDIEHKTVQQL